jgi:pimeloyl-ACP methyl ester carboxylesterase
MSSPVPLGSVVLVHGAWADGSCWSDVILPLQTGGFNVSAASLPLTSLTDDVAALHRAIERMPGPVTLVGHAYGGAVISAVHHDRVQSLVFISALAPDEGETVADVFYRATPHAKAPQLAPDPHGFIWMPDEGFGNAVAHKAAPDRLAIMSAVQRPIAIQCIQEKSPTPAWKSKPSWYFVAEDDRMIPQVVQEFMAGRMRASTCSHRVDHSPMYTAPDLVVGIIHAAALGTPVK